MTAGRAHPGRNGLARTKIPAGQPCCAAIRAVVACLLPRTMESQCRRMRERAVQAGDGPEAQREVARALAGKRQELAQAAVRVPS